MLSQRPGQPTSVRENYNSLLRKGKFNTARAAPTGVRQQFPCENILHCGIFEQQTDHHFLSRYLGLHRTQILYLLFYLIFFVFVGEEAFALQDRMANPASGHACCAAAPSSQEGVPAGKGTTVDCHGDLCCCHPGAPRAVEAVRTGSGAYPLPPPAPVLQPGQPFPPALVPVADQPPPLAFSPLYLRNCALLI